MENLLATAARFSQRTAIVEDAKALTYADVLERVAAVSATLRAGGLQPGDRVALALPNGIGFVAAYYGALHAGGVVVPLNVAGKAPEIQAWLADCDASWIFAEPSNREAAAAIANFGLDRGFSPAAQGLDAALVLFGTFQSSSNAFAGPQPALDPAAPACIVYTSGTTGRPKGVVLSHLNLAANTAAIVEYLQLTERDSIATVLPFYYSYGSSILHSHIQAGGCVVIEKNLVYPHAVIETLAAQRCSGFAGVPATFALLLQRVKLQDYELSGLRYVTQAGGAMSPVLTQRLRDALPHACVIVMYGQTEATARLTFLPPEHLSGKLGSVGVPIPGVSIEIRDEYGRPAAAGQAGEVWARGANVMLGYWRNDAATAEVKREGWLKTGDMGWLDADGFLYLVGRRSDMIKVGAHRIHPQEIEAVIAELPQVQETAVVGVDDELLGQSIKAYIVPAAATTLTAMQIQAHCRARLANYKIPRSVEFLAALPRTGSGKVRRAELIESTKQ